ncbi:MAG: thiamine biosynthesis protein ApbE [Methylibium sp. NZG]|nr:MAG: thiamine biosynthesis protein ApbE [Methylibium sp. NZG]
MACDCEVRIAGLSRRKAEPLAKLAIAEVQRIESKFSRYRAASVVSRINASAGSGRSVEVDAETAHLLDFAATLHASSGGLFDATSGTLRKAWDFKAKRLPSAAQIDALLPLIGWQHVRWRNGQWTGGRIELPIAGMELDFGGFGKEYAADRAATLLQQHGLRHGMVNLGGDIRLVGPRPDGQPWSLGIQHPRDETRLLATLALGDGALATSGDYERCFDLDGVRYCHVLNPRTGWPVQAWRSVSVIAPACLAAGALTTVAMLKGDAALEFLAGQGVGYLAVDATGQVHRHAADVVMA